MTLNEDWVYCETEGDLHVNQPDPFQYGPRYANEDYKDEPGWALKDLPKDHPDWPGSTLWHYTCPGPHRKVWIGGEIGASK